MMKLKILNMLFASAIIFGCSGSPNPEGLFVEKLVQAIASKNRAKIEDMFASSEQIANIINDSTETEDWKKRNIEKTKIFDIWKSKFYDDVERNIYKPLFGVEWKRVRIVDFKFTATSDKLVTHKCAIAATDSKRDFKLTANLCLIKGRFYCVKESDLRLAVFVDN
jgi:hypothetical protein